MSDLRLARIPLPALLLLLFGCIPIEADPVCEPGETQLCVCGGDSTGAQACEDDGAGWSTCECGEGDDDDATAGDDDDDATPGDDDDATQDDDDATPGDDDDATQDDDDATQDDDDATQDPVITETVPADGATDVYHRTDILVEFSDPVTQAAVLLEGPGGATVTGTTTLSDNDTALTFDPHGISETDHLDPSTAYTADITWGASSSAQIQFVTSETGTAVADPQNDIVGRDYLVDTASMRFVQPSGVGALLQQYLADLHWVFHVQALNDGAQRGELITAWVEETGGDFEQNLCCPTTTLSDATVWVNPYVEAGPADVTASLTGYDVTLLDAVLAGSFRPDGSGIEGVTIETQLDTRELDPLIDPHAKEGATCALLVSLGITCQTCPDGSGDFCLLIEADQGTAEEVDVTSSDPETGQPYDHVVEISPAMAADWVNGGFCDPCDSSCSLVAGTRPRGVSALLLLLGVAVLWRRRLV